MWKQCWTTKFGRLRPRSAQDVNCVQNKTTRIYVKHGLEKRHCARAMQTQPSCKAAPPPWQPAPPRDARLLYRYGAGAVDREFRGIQGWPEGGQGPAGGSWRGQACGRRLGEQKVAGGRGLGEQQVVFRVHKTLVWYMEFGPRICQLKWQQLLLEPHLLHAPGAGSRDDGSYTNSLK